MKFTNDFLEKTDKIKRAIDVADAIVIGAGAGLSTSAGFTYSGERFEKFFADFHKKYGFSDMYSGGFYPYETPEEFWAFWSRNIFVNRYAGAPKPVYEDLLSVVKDKNYFVITTNVDHCFQKAGFNKERLFYTQGDYGLFQCSLPCHNKTYDNKDAVTEMYLTQKNMKIPSELIPKCPVCGRPMTTNLRIDGTFVEDEGWKRANERYAKFIKDAENKRTVFLELGVGGNTPAIIKYPFWRMTYANEKSTYICVNFGEAVCPDQIKSRSICLNADIGEVITAIK